MKNSFEILVVLVWGCQLIRGDPIDAILDDNYDAKARPGSEGQPLEVKVKMIIEDVEEIDDDEQEISMGFEIQETWFDTRPNRSKGPILRNPLVDDAFRLWSPETHFANSKDSLILKNFQIISSDGRVTKLVQARVTATCQMRFFYFPFDKHVCTLKIINMEYSDKDLIYSWLNSKDAFKLQPSVSATRMFTVAGYQLGNVSVPGLLGNHSGLELQLLFARKSARSFPVYYFPAVALCLIAFMSLWLESKLMGIYLSLASFLTMVVFFATVQAQIPRYFDMTMFDHYLFVCLNIILNVVFVNFLTYGYLSSGKKRSTTQKEKLEMKNFNGSNGEAEDPEQLIDDPEEHIKEMSKFKQFVYFKSCKPAKYHQPLGFLIINVIYWLWIGIAKLQTPQGFQKL